MMRQWSVAKFARQILSRLTPTADQAELLAKLKFPCC